jgi:dTMP kinase
MAARGKRGLFITLEGIEGAGKSTHCGFLRRLFARHGRRVVLTREPGGTRLGEQIRKLLLYRGRGHVVDERTELLLMFCARQQHIDEVIRPALAAGRIVICDRFTDSTYAYQGGGHRIPAAEIRALEKWVQRGLKPDLTLLFDLPVAAGLKRAGSRAGRGRARGGDWFESRTLRFFERVRRRFLEIARAEPRRVRIIDANRPMDRIQADLRRLIERKSWI